MMKYIIDLERINQLTSHPADAVALNQYTQSPVYSITKGLIKKYLEIFESRNFKSNRVATHSEEDIKEAILILRYNKILISEADMRDKKIIEILE